MQLLRRLTTVRVRRYAVYALTFLPVNALADERRVVVGVGGAFETEVRDGSLHGGVNAMLEVEAIEGWLEIELEASVVSADVGFEVPVALTFKKPFQISRRWEIMFGFGPEMLIASAPTPRVYGGIECVVDLMFWPTKHIGAWLEPSYDVIFRLPASSGLGGTGGVIFGW